MIHPQFYCTGCHTILCGECATGHFGAVGCCLEQMKGSKWPLTHYEEHLKNQEKEEALSFRFEEGANVETDF